MLGASTKTVLGDRLAQATGDQLAERLGVDVVVQGSNLKGDALLGVVIEEEGSVAKGSVAEQRGRAVQEDDVDLFGPERGSRGGGEGKAQVESLTRGESRDVENRHVHIRERTGRASGLRTDEVGGNHLGPV